MVNLQLTKRVENYQVRCREQAKQEIRRIIQDALHNAKALSPSDCLHMIRDGLLEAQDFSKSVGKNFIFVEKSITCDQYELGGNCCEQAILFRGPNEDASVAICVTRKGSLLHRNDSPWRVYKNMGDVSPQKCLSPL